MKSPICVPVIVQRERVAPAKDEMRFDGSSGRRPSAEARRYVYAVTAAALDTDMKDPGGWCFGGLKNEFDRRRVKRAAKYVIAELLRKAKS